ncbi:MAG: hypothetical protein LBR56_03940 [Sporomusaceae bacterium]|nr:hypothetical protein [Sporomusaceae bacterium]
MISNAGRLIEKSLKTSRMEGLRQGKLEGKLEAAENLLNEGLDEKFIAKALGLSPEEVSGLKIKK